MRVPCSGTWTLSGGKADLMVRDVGALQSEGGSPCREHGISQWRKVELIVGNVGIPCWEKWISRWRFMESPYRKRGISLYGGPEISLFGNVGYPWS